MTSLICIMCGVIHNNAAAHTHSAYATINRIETVLCVRPKFYIAEILILFIFFLLESFKQWVVMIMISNWILYYYFYFAQIAHAAKLSQPFFLFLFYFMKLKVGNS